MPHLQIQLLEERHPNYENAISESSKLIILCALAEVIFALRPIPFHSIAK